MTDYFVYADTEENLVEIQYNGDDFHQFCCQLIGCHSVDICPSDFRIDGLRIYIIFNGDKVDTATASNVNFVATYMVRGKIFLGDVILCSMSSESDGDHIFQGFERAQAFRLTSELSPSHYLENEPIEYVDL